MSEIAYRNGVLHVEDMPVARIAEAVGTPFYCYSSAHMLARYEAYARAFADRDATIYYAVKANANLAVIRAFARAGAGADVVSAGELRRALAAGVPAGRIVFAGVGKTREELAEAVRAGICQVNIESEAELRALGEVAAALGATAPAGLRVNPDVDPRTHAKISTGRKDSKFGVDIAEAPAMFALAAALPGVSMASLSVHIGSQLTDLEAYRGAYARLRAATLELRAAGHAVDHLDLGGGLGIAYDGRTAADLAAYAAIVGETVGDLGCRLGFEPGRFLTGESGLLVARVVRAKPGAGKRFVVVDAAMNDLVRPTLYDAHHDIAPAVEPAPDAPRGLCDIVGPICESGDFIARDRLLPDFAEGDLLAARCAGAYGAVMSSTYNSRPLVPEVLVSGAAFAVVRRRWTVEEAMALERMPPWLAAEPGGGAA